MGRKDPLSLFYPLINFAKFVGGAGFHDHMTGIRKTPEFRWLTTLTAYIRQEAPRNSTSLPSFRLLVSGNETGKFLRQQSVQRQSRIARLVLLVSLARPASPCALEVGLLARSGLLTL